MFESILIFKEIETVKLTIAATDDAPIKKPAQIKKPSTKVKKLTSLILEEKKELPMVIPACVIQ